jgi:hypothetical protein
MDFSVDALGFISALEDVLDRRKELKRYEFGNSPTNMVVDYRFELSAS